MSKVTVICLDWRPLAKGSLRGFAKIRVVEWRMTLTDVAVHENPSARWAAMPARAWIRNNALVLDNGKIQYSPVIELDSKEVRDGFSQRVVEALFAAFPRAFDGESAP